MSKASPEEQPVDYESGVDGTPNSNLQPPKVGDKRKSEYWNHFWDIRDPVTSKIINARCKYCNKLLTGGTNNGTSSLKKHLNSCSKYPANVDKKQKLISVFKSSNAESATISNWEFDQSSCRLALAKMVIVDEQPLSIVKREGLSSFVM